MTNTFTNPNSTSWSAIARRVVERSHVTNDQPCERDFGEEPRTLEDAKAEALKFNWQH